MAKEKNNKLEAIEVNNQKIVVEITVRKVGDVNYISLTDLVKNMDGKEDQIKNWIRNRNTVEFLGC